MMNPEPTTPTHIPGRRRLSALSALLAAAGLSFPCSSAFTQTDLYFNSASDADWHQPGIWSTDGSDSVDWKDGSNANLIMDGQPVSDTLTIDVKRDVTVASLNKVLIVNNAFRINGNGGTITNTSGNYNIVGGGSGLWLLNVFVAGDDTITKTGSGPLVFANNIQGVAPTRFDVREGPVNWGAGGTNWNPSTSIHVEAGAEFRFTAGLADDSFEMTGLTGGGNVGVRTNRSKQLVLNIAEGDPVVLEGAIVRIQPDESEHVDIIKYGAGTQLLGGINTIVGDVTVNAGALGFADGGELRFELADGGETNQVLGTGTVNFDGLFRLNAGAVSATEGSWQLIDVDSLDATFGKSFSLVFADGTKFSNRGGGIHTSGDWTFDTGTGILRLAP